MFKKPHNLSTKPPGSVRKIRIALVGNPNSGKSTLFNLLTGAAQYVGNWPGVTVEKKEGSLEFGGEVLEIVDLPGIYSLLSYSPEEKVSTKFLLSGRVDVIVNIVDATNLARNLYLTTGLIELGLPVVLAVNMVDMLGTDPRNLPLNLLENALNVQAVGISANKNIGIQQLILKTVKAAKASQAPHANIYPQDVRRDISKVEQILKKELSGSKLPPRHLAICALEGDWTFLQNLRFEARKEILNVAKGTHNDTSQKNSIARERYRFIDKLAWRFLKNVDPPKLKKISEKIDEIVLNKFFAFPIFLTIISLVFYVTFGPLGQVLRQVLENFIRGPLASATLKLLISLGASAWAQSLVVEGMIGGMGAVFSFLPQIALLFVMLTLLEDSGYMARAAFIIDLPMQKIGLSGRAFLPLLLGFGCTVPAVLGTRILESERDKKITIFLLPFISCSAKMPIYALLAGALFDRGQFSVIFSLYLLGLLIAVFTALFLKNIGNPGELAPFLMEMPFYRLPTFKNLARHVTERLKDFVSKIGTVLLAASIVIWFLQSFDANLNMVADSSKSILAALGSVLVPIFSPCGFGDWRAVVSLLSGFAAKESIVSSMSILYSTPEFSGLEIALRQAFTPLVAYSFMVFVLLYTPCVAAVSAILRESRSLCLTGASVLYQFAIAWFASACVFQFGRLFANIF